ncbi:MAG: SPOR domain-containing protein [Marinibacterium sp.]
MAEMDFAPGDGASQMRASGQFASAINIAGAVMSLALVAGIGVWGYKLMMRDVSGVPVVRALEGPMRVQPEDPGGRPADHQGLAVNAVAARGEAAPTPDQLVLAPRPVALTSEDLPQAELPPLARTDERAQAASDLVKTGSAAQTLPAPASGTGAADGEGAISETTLTAFQEGSVDALVEELTRGVTPLAFEGAQPAAQIPETPEEAPPATGPVSADLPGVKRSLRPLARPAGLVRPDAAATEAALRSQEIRDVDPATLAPGTRLAQLGAYDSPKIARSEWDSLASRFADYMDGKARVVQKASSGGRTFYRLRVMGFEDLADARRFCSALVAEGADCIPVVTR